jgi:roadblock/LC7 domain-containing protein
LPIFTKVRNAIYSGSSRGAMQIRSLTLIAASLCALGISVGTAQAQTWETIAGIKVRKNPQAQMILSNGTYSYYQSYNSGGGSGGYSA